MRAVFLTLIVWLASTSPAHAWNSRGHMMVAAIAWDTMTPAARAKATELVRLNPSYGTWTKGVSAGDKDRVAFVKAATWPDEIRNAPGYVDNLPTGQVPGDGYDDMRIHGDWHYKNLPLSADGTPTRPAATPNAQTQIEAFSMALADMSLPDTVRSYDLAWLLHLVGDVHQPLHATARFSQELPGGDRGGGRIDVCTSPCSRTTSLHSFWDGALGTNSKPLSAIAAAARLVRPSQALGRVSSPGTWLDESLTLATSTAYRSPIGDGAGPYELTAEYRRDVGAVAERRVALAGVRLGNLLTQALDPH